MRKLRRLATISPFGRNERREGTSCTGGKGKGMVLIGSSSDEFSHGRSKNEERNVEIMGETKKEQVNDASQNNY